MAAGITSVTTPGARPITRRCLQSSTLAHTSLVSSGGRVHSRVGDTADPTPASESTRILPLPLMRPRRGWHWCSGSPEPSPCHQLAVDSTPANGVRSGAASSRPSARASQFLWWPARLCSTSDSGRGQHCVAVISSLVLAKARNMSPVSVDHNTLPVCQFLRAFGRAHNSWYPVLAGYDGCVRRGTAAVHHNRRGPLEERRPG